MQRFWYENWQRQIDPAMKSCGGVHCMIIDNSDIAKGRSNGTLRRVVGVKRTATPHCNGRITIMKKYMPQM